MHIYIDFETYYDKQYSLTKMTTPEYVCDPRFKVLGVAIAIDNGPAQWYDELPDLPYESSTVIAHNCYFDAMILTLHYKRKAKEYICTQALARYALPQAKSNSLKETAKILGLRAKTEGLTEGSDKVNTKLTEYAINDVEICRDISNLLLPTLSPSARSMHSLVLRWGVEPALHGNIAKFREAAATAEAERNRLISLAIDQYEDLSEDQLVSNQKFAKYLNNVVNIDVPMKKDSAFTPALSKGDPEFQAMIAKHIEHKTLWDARLASKSTIKVSRPTTLANVCEATGGLLPMPLKWFGAHTGRQSGHDGFNVQNLENGSVARTAIEAPPGYVIVVADSSQIELRLNAWWSKEQRVFDILNKGECIYIHAAAAHYGVPYPKFTKASPERKLGKAIVLGSGYGMGAERFNDFCASGPLGMDPMLLTDEEALKAVTSYRATHPNIADNWRTHQEYIRVMYSGIEKQIGPITLLKNAIKLPNGTLLQYFDLRCEESNQASEQWLYNETDYIYGARLQENIVQALANVVICDQILALEAEGIQTVSMTHDEILAICPENQADAVLKRMIEIMSITPDWAKIPGYPTLTLAAEGGYARNYSK